MTEALKRFLLAEANTPNQAKAHLMQQFLNEVTRLEARAALFDTPEFAWLARGTALKFTDAEWQRLAKAYYFNPVALFEDAAK